MEEALSNHIVHSCTWIFEFLGEEKLLVDLTVTEKNSLEFRHKIGGNGQGDLSEYSQKNGANKSGGSIYCISYVPLQLKANGRLLYCSYQKNVNVLVESFFSRLQP